MEYGTPPVDNRTPQIEPWVDAATVGAHLGFKPDHIRKLANQNKLPGVQMQNGARVYWRFKLSAVDAAMGAATIRLAMPMMSAMADMGARA